MLSGPTASAPREVCARCRRPRRVCYCAALPTLETRTRVVILQHPRERDMPIGTARMASLCLPQASLHVGVRWDDRPELHAALADPARPPILLYPGPGAKDILREPPAGPVTLVVVDGTWSQAKTVVRDNPVLRALPRYAFDAPEPSQYRIRREPRDEYVSTIEALMHVLGALEGDAPRFRALLEPLRAMVDAQLAARAGAWTPRYRVPKPARTPRQRLPALLRERWDDLVCVVGEANAWPYVGPAAAAAAAPGLDAPRGGDELVHWVAYRPASGERFEALCAPERALSPTTTFHVELDEARLRAAPPRAELCARFAAFTRATDVMCAWGSYGPQLLVEGGGALPAARVDLRAVAKQLAGGRPGARVGTLEAYAAAVDAPARAPLGDGRAGRRLAMIARVLDAWRALP